MLCLGAATLHTMPLIGIVGGLWHCFSLGFTVVVPVFPNTMQLYCALTQPRQAKTSFTKLQTSNNTVAVGSM